MDIMALVSDIGTVAKTAGQVLDVVKKVKDVMKGGGGAPSAPTAGDTMGGGAAFMPQLTQLAAQQGSAWLPQQTGGWQGVDMTGLWVAPFNPADQTYVRQSGVLVNMVTGAYLAQGGAPMGFAEGVFDPSHRTVHVVGRWVNGLPLEVRAILMPTGALSGAVATPNAFGMMMQMPIFLCRA